ncbi:MAG TPA: universal stress protein, partial [Trebonia sp.]
MVVGIRDPNDTAGTLAYAFDEAALRGATLIAVHSWNWSRSALGDHADSRDTASAERIAAEADLSLSAVLRSW